MLQLNDRYDEHVLENWVLGRPLVRSGKESSRPRIFCFELLHVMYQVLVPFLMFAINSILHHFSCPPTCMIWKMNSILPHHNFLHSLRIHFWSSYEVREKKFTNPGSYGHLFWSGLARMCIPGYVISPSK